MKPPMMKAIPRPPRPNSCARSTMPRLTAPGASILEETHAILRPLAKASSHAGVDTAGRVATSAVWDLSSDLLPSSGLRQATSSADTDWDRGSWVVRTMSDDESEVAHRVAWRLHSLLDDVSPVEHPPGARLCDEAFLSRQVVRLTRANAHLDEGAFLHATETTRDGRIAAARCRRLPGWQEVTADASADDAEAARAKLDASAPPTDFPIPEALVTTILSSSVDDETPLVASLVGALRRTPREAVDLTLGEDPELARKARRLIVGA